MGSSCNYERWFDMRIERYQSIGGLSAMKVRRLMRDYLARPIPVGSLSELLDCSPVPAKRVLAHLERRGFRRALAKVAHEKPRKRSAAIRGSYEGMIRQLEEELREYDQSESGELKMPKIDRLDEIAPLIV